MLFSPDQESRAQAYAASHELVLAQTIGSGTDGAVWKATKGRQKLVLKVFERDKQYRTELACYQRLTENRIRKIGQFAVPRLVGWSDELLVVEIALVTPPYLIDFGKAYLDSAPEHSEETWEYHHEEQRDLWGDKYAEVQALLWQLERIGIYYQDAKPGNITFPPDPPPVR